MIAPYAFTPLRLVNHVHPRLLGPGVSGKG